MKPEDIVKMSKLRGNRVQQVIKDKTKYTRKIKNPKKIHRDDN